MGTTLEEGIWVEDGEASFELPLSAEATEAVLAPALLVGGLWPHS